MSAKKGPARKHGTVTFYLQDAYRGVFDSFVKYVNADKQLEQEQTKKGRNGVIGPAIIKLITKYVREMDKLNGIDRNSPQSQETEDASEEEVEE